MQFSTQQVAGGAQYGPRTRVGNWFEDIVLQEERYAEFRKKKETGKLAIGFRSRRFNLCLQKVPHTYSTDGKLRFGDTVTIYNDSVKATLANDPFEEVMPQSAKFMVTASRELAATARTTFILTRVSAPSLDGGASSSKAWSEEDVLHYGQPFHLTTNPAIRVDDNVGVLQPPLYLSSTAKTDRAASKWSNRQMVYMSATPDYNTVWKALRPAKAKFDGISRQFSELEAVEANGQVVLVHKNTNKPLAVDPKYGESTDFGGEYEVVAHSFVGLGKNELVAAERRGEATGLSITKPEQAGNIWVLGTAASPPPKGEQQQDHLAAATTTTTTTIPPAVSPEAILKFVRSFLSSHGYSVATVRAKLPKLNGLSKLDREDVKWVFRELDLPRDMVAAGYLDLWLDTLDTKADGMIPLKLLLSELRGSSAPLPPARLAVAEAAFDKLQSEAASSSGGSSLVVPLSLALKHYNINALPKVVGRVVSGEAALSEFSAVAGSSGGGATRGTTMQVVTRDDFLEYYRDVSAEVGGLEGDDEPTFMSIVKASWGL